MVCDAASRGAELATPLMSAVAATARGTRQAPITVQWESLLLGMMDFTSIP